MKAKPVGHPLTRKAVRPVDVISQGKWRTVVDISQCKFGSVLKLGWGSNGQCHDDSQTKAIGAMGQLCSSWGKAPKDEQNIENDVDSLEPCQDGSAERADQDVAHNDGYVDTTENPC
jgi:hypothetical protein